MVISDMVLFRAGYVKLANQYYAGYLSSLALIRTLRGSTGNPALRGRGYRRYSFKNNMRVSVVKEKTGKRTHHLRVPVFENEKQIIEQAACQAGLSIAAYLRRVGMGTEVVSIIDHKQVHELAIVNGDLGRLGGLLKLWLTQNPLTKGFTLETIRVLLGKIEANQHLMRTIMQKIVQRK